MRRREPSLLHRQPPQATAHLLQIPTHSIAHTRPILPKPTTSTTATTTTHVRHRRTRTIIARERPLPTHTSSIQMPERHRLIRSGTIKQPLLLHRHPRIAMSTVALPRLSHTIMATIHQNRLPPHRDLRPRPLPMP
jgi:hypothetical protein